MATDVVIEDVPRFTRRYGDQVIEGSNNNVIILGTDRAKKGPATVDDGLGHVDAPGSGKGAGSIHLIVGRSAPDPDLDKDDAYLYLGRKTEVDTNLGLDGVENAPSPVQTKAAILKSDCVRIVGRKDIKVCANDDDKHYLFMDGKKTKLKFGDGATVEITDKKIVVKMGSNTVEVDDKKAVVTVSSTILTLDGKEVKIDSPKVHLTGGCEVPWEDLFKALIDMTENHNHMSAVGPTTPALAGPATAAVDAALKAKKAAWDAKVKS